MKVKKLMNKKYKFLAVLLLLSVSMAFTLMEGDGGRKSEKITLKAGDAYRMFINNIDMPLNRAGVIADANISGGQYGKIDGKVFLYSAGFFMSGITNGTMWANAVASASRIQDYAPGTYESGRTDPRAQIYVVAARDGEFAPSWEDWRDAVALGADFYDGDGDGIYNPVDKNSNGKWDSDEDRPDLIGDETVWTVYHDAVNPALRRFNDVDPQGIEVRQTVFAFASKGVTGNMIFVRYNILNTGLVADVIDSVYFGVWADPDLGDAYDDLVGCDVPLNAGYVYNDGDDADFGANPPCFMIDFFQGPVAYVPGETFEDTDGNGHYDEGIDVPLDTAYNVRGVVRGIEEFPGAKNLGLSSFVHYQQSDTRLGDPNNRFEARNYMLGQTRLAEPGEPNPCTWYLSNAGFPGCDTVDNRFWYSGDPVTNTGWINNTAVDQRQMSNTGPFELEVGKPVTIIAAYVVGRGTNALNSITEARSNDVTAQIIFDANFPSPPPPPPVAYNIQTGENFIDITIETSPQLLYRAVDTVLDVDKRIQGFYITSYRTNIKAGSINGIDNKNDLVFYNMKDSIDAIYRVAGNGGQDLIIPAAPPENVFDSLTFVDPDLGRIKLRVTQDPFTGGPLIKGKEYYFTITQYAVNHNVVVNRATGTYGPAGDYLDPTGSGLEEIETQIIPVTFAKDLYSPAQLNGTGEQVAGASAGAVAFLPINLNELTGDDYAVEFFKDEAAPSTVLYTPFWRLRNETKGTIVLDSSKVYNFDTTNYAGKIYEGMIVKVKPTTTSIGAPSYEPDDNVWYSRFSFEGGLGVWYVGGDVASSDDVLTGAVPNFGLASARSNAISADRLRTVEIRFGVQGKAYRYLNGYIGNVATAPTSYRYAGGLYPGAPGITNPSVLNDIGLPGEGYVDVPFQVWVKDDRYGEEKQLACGFIEKRSTRNGIPDGIWNPDTSIARTFEYIFILDAPYDPNGSQIEYTGGVFGTDTIWADPLRGYTIPASFTGVTEEQRKIAASPWFNTMYVVGLQKTSPESFYQPGDVFTIPLTQYPYTGFDRFTFSTKRGDLNADEKRALFEKVNVYPNPLYAHNPATSFNGGNPDEPFVTFSNLPEEVTVKIFTLSGTLIRTLTTEDKATPTLPFLNWNLLNEDGLRVASGMYLAIVSAPEYGEKVLKFAVIMPQKQIQRF